MASPQAIASFFGLTCKETKPPKERYIFLGMALLSLLYLYFVLVPAIKEGGNLYEELLPLLPPLFLINFGIIVAQMLYIKKSREDPCLLIQEILSVRGGDLRWKKALLHLNSQVVYAEDNGRVALAVVGRGITGPHVLYFDILTEGKALDRKRKGRQLSKEELLAYLQGKGI